MKKFVLLFLLCAVSAFAVTTAITTSYDDCYSACKSGCVEKYSADECQRICVLMCKTQAEPSLVDEKISSVVVTKAVSRGDIIELPPGKPVSCRDECDWALRMCETYNYKTDCKGAFEKCAVICELQTASPVTVPPVELTCERRCWMIQDECKRAGVDDASCKMKIDSCLKGCNPQPTPVCDCAPQPTCEYSCETECGVGYHKCKAAGAGNCGKVVVDCLDQCRFVAPPERCEDQCAKIKQVCKEQGLTETQCEPKLKDCMTRCYPQPMPAVGVKSEVYSGPLPSVARQEVKDEILPERVPEPIKEKSFVARIWSSIFGG